MKPFETDDYKIFDLFNNHWALVTAGEASHYNTCTISWAVSAPSGAGPSPLCTSIRTATPGSS